MMTTASLFSFFAKPKIIIDSFARMFQGKDRKEDVLKDIELPMWVFIVGVPVFGLITVYMAHVFFGVHYLMGLISLPLVFVFTLIAVNATGLTSITPTGALGKLTQLTFGVLAPGNITTNIQTASITGLVAGNAANLLMDIKPGYMLGGKPRHQAVGHILGIIAGSLASVPVFYLILNGDVTLLGSDQIPVPGAQVWRGVAEVLTRGLSFLHPTAQLAIVIGGLLGIATEVAGKMTKGRFPISGVGFGLAFVLKFTDSLSMALGAFLFWALAKKPWKGKSLGFRVFVENQETVCAGVIAGGAIVGILLIIIQTVFLGG